MSSSINRASSSSSKTLRSKIEKIIFGGNGLTRIHGCVTFVPFAAPGDDAELMITQKKKSYQTATIQRIFQNGPGRRAAKCPHFQTCGGCQLQHLDYKTQLKAKQGFIQEALRIEPVKVYPSKEWQYRTHIRLNLRRKGAGFQMGYIAMDNHSLVEPSTCPIFSNNEDLFHNLKEELAALPNERIKSASLRLFKTEEGILAAFSFYPTLPKKIVPLSFTVGTAYKSPGKEKHLGNTTLSYNVAGLSVPFSPYGFMQNNLPLSSTLYKTLIDMIGEEKQTIYDLYCGVGITATLLSRKGHTVTGVELNHSLNPCGDFKIHYGLAEKVVPKLQESPDVIIVNPPRTGLSKELLPYLNSPRLFYISCMPATLARDVERLKDRYHLTHVEGFDLFPQTTHVETLASFVLTGANKK